MKIKFISVFLISLMLPLIVSGQSETYTVGVTGFSTRKNDEFSPVYYKDGLVFCSNKNWNLFRNYMTTEEKGLLKINFVDLASGKVKLFSRTLSTKYNDGPAAFSKNYDTIYFSRNLKVVGDFDEISGPRNKLGIFTAVLENGDWVKILDLRFNNEYFNITTPSISPDGKMLFFASDNPAGAGGTDLYYCNWKNDYWDEPVNMGPEINTPGNESYPSAASDGGLFFSSDGHPGLGGKDIFYSRQKNGRWLPPVRLDAPINSESDDFGFISDPEMSRGYFSSHRGSSVDIYEFKTNITQLFYCDYQRTNQYCFKFTSEDKIPVDSRYLQLVWSFGDGGTATGLNAEHCFKGPGKYTVRLDAVDKKTGRVFFSKLSYNLDLKDIEQPVIISPASAIAGEPVNFDGLKSNFPGSLILNHTWYFGDGNRSKDEILSHTYAEKGDYEVRLGLMVRDDKTGVIRQSCVVKPLRVFATRAEKEAFDKIKPQSAPVINILDYDHASLGNIFSAEKDYAENAVYRLEIVKSKTKLAPGDKAFTNLPVKYSVKEHFLPDEKVYSYSVDEQLSLMATYPSFNEISGLGFVNARVIPAIVDDPAERELNNLEKVFGVSSDLYFRANDFNLTSSGTQMLDLVLGILVKYPDLKLEIACHTDNTGTVYSSQLLTRRRAEAMVNYLVNNGVSRTRLTAAGYGGTRPVAPNYQESDRKNNRRIDFTVIRITK